MEPQHVTSKTATELRSPDDPATLLIHTPRVRLGITTKQVKKEKNIYKSSPAKRLLKQRQYFKETETMTTVNTKL